MRTFAQKPTQQVKSAHLANRSQNAEGRSILNLQRMIGNQAVQRLAQNNALHDLPISSPDDLSEREADHVANTVMRMAKPDLTSAAPVTHTAPGAIAGGGHGLPASVRGFFEPRFGHNFAQVRVHADSQAAEMAKGFSARAFTIGNDIYFGSGQYAPGTSGGDKLLAHELTHTIQQSRSGSNFVGRSQNGIAPIGVSAAEPCIQRKEEVLASDVTPGNPLDRQLTGKPPGLTTPFVNDVEIKSNKKLLEAIPVTKAFSKGSQPDTCKASNPPDIKSKVKIIAADDPGKAGWKAKASYETINKVLKVTNKDCEAKKDNIDVRLVAAAGNKAFATYIRTAEGDHEKAFAGLHAKYLKPYHDLVDSKVGSNAVYKTCAVDLFKDLAAKRDAMATDWMTAWNDSIDKLDADGGPHQPKVKATVTGKCDEVLVTVL